jgi:hypothetical protein
MNDEILKRVIDEQQKTIDELKAKLERSETARKEKDKSFSEYYDERDKFFKHLTRLVSASAWKHIDPKTCSKEEWRDYTHEIRMYMIERGFCFNCETCNCFGDCYE